MTTPSVKGSIVAGAVEDLVRLRDEGRVSAEQLEMRLEPYDLTLLGTKLGAAEWYPMATYGRLLEVLGDIESGGRRDAYFRKRGAASARRLMDAGLYQQLSFIQRWSENLPKDRGDEASLVNSFSKNLRLVITLAKSIYSVGVWAVEPDPATPRRVAIHVTEARDYTEPMRLAAEGFLNATANRRSDLYTSERPGPSEILFRMTMDISELR